MTSNSSIGCHFDLIPRDEVIVAPNTTDSFFPHIVALSDQHLLLSTTRVLDLRLLADGKYQCYLKDT